MKAERWACPCCGYKTLTERPPGTYAICPVCFWEDDPIQFEDPAYRGGAYPMSFDEARVNFRNLGAKDARAKPHVRPPREEEVP